VFCLSQVVLDVVHKHRITGEKSCGRVSVPIADMKHGVYEQKWYPVQYGKGTRTSKVGEIFLKILLHTEGLTKEERRNSIRENMEDLQSSRDSNSSTPPGSPGRGPQTTSSMQNVPNAQNMKKQSAATLQVQIDLETRLQAMERSMAQVTQMMANVVEKVGRLP
jgi:hypothetical protein